MTSGTLYRNALSTPYNNIQYNNLQLPPTTTSTVVHVRSSECAAGIPITGDHIFHRSRLCPSMTTIMMIVTHNLCQFSGKRAKFWVPRRIVDFRTLLIKFISSKPSQLTSPITTTMFIIHNIIISKACITVRGTNMI